jgi:rare lipoprotein A
MRHTKGLLPWRAVLAIIATLALFEIVLACAAHADIASVYPNGGPRACPGRYSGHTVAHRSMPCGTRLRFTRGRHSIVAVVNDRGPFIRGRTWDFPQRSAGALGFNDGLVKVHAERL